MSNPKMCRECRQAIDDGTQSERLDAVEETRHEAKRAELGARVLEILREHYAPTNAADDSTLRAEADVAANVWCAARSIGLLGGVAEPTK